MVKILEGFPEKWLADDGRQIVPLRDFCREARLKKGISISRLNLDSGLGHPTVNNYEKGKYQSLPAMVTALLTLGYEIEVKPPEVKDG